LFKVFLLNQSAAGSCANASMLIIATTDERINFGERTSVTEWLANFAKHSGIKRKITNASLIY
jgi:hypothetical protein